MLAVAARGVADTARLIAESISTRAADAVDREGRFPHESIGALRQEGLLGAYVPAAFGGRGATIPELAAACEGGVSHSWGLDPWQRGSFALHAPGQIGFLDVLAKAEGRIHFAGEHTSIDAQGSSTAQLKAASARRRKCSPASRRSVDRPI